MELHEARSRIQVMLNFFKGMQKIEEVIATAEAADRLCAEREAAVLAVGEKLAEANAAYALACETHAKLSQNMKDEIAALKKKHADTLVRIEEEVVAAETQKVAAVAVARTKQAEAEHETQQAIDFLTQRKAVLEKDVKSLEGALDKLRSKVANL